jgi:hypothetical protein
MLCKNPRRASGNSHRGLAGRSLELKYTIMLSRGICVAGATLGTMSDKKGSSLHTSGIPVPAPQQVTASNGPLSRGYLPVNWFSGVQSTTTDCNTVATVADMR